VERFMSHSLSNLWRRGVRTSAAACLLSIAACEADRLVVPGDRAVRERIVRTQSGSYIQTRVDHLWGAATSPTVVLMSGLDTPLEMWSELRTQLARDVRVFSYDRAGVGRSGTVSGSRQATVVAQELHETLRAAGVPGPYILVAHSIGGLYARVFANRYASTVAGVVLVDATHETLLGMLGPEDLAAIAADLKYPGAQREVLAQARSVEEVLAAPLPDVPLSVITSMKPEPGQGPEVREWFAELQGEWLRQVTRGEQVRTTAGHMIPLEEPALIASAIRRVIGWSRASK
jgi:pimeloyl-ACP methyl ester carboxylesterase